MHQTLPVLLWQRPCPCQAQGAGDTDHPRRSTGSISYIAPIQEALLLKGKWMVKHWHLPWKLLQEGSHTFFYKCHSGFALGLHALTSHTASEGQDTVLSLAIRAAPAGIPSEYSKLMTVSQLSDGNRGGTFGCVFLLQLPLLSYFWREGRKKRRYVLSFLKALPAFAVSLGVCSPLAATDRGYSPSFISHIIFFRSIICDS